MIDVHYGTFRMLKPVISQKGYRIVGAFVLAERLIPYILQVPVNSSVRRAMHKIRMQIQKDHPGIKEMLGSYGAYN